VYDGGNQKRDHLEASHLCVSNIWEAFWRLISPYNGWHCLGVREYAQRLNTMTSLRTYTHLNAFVHAHLPVAKKLHTSSCSQNNKRSSVPIFASVAFRLMLCWLRKICCCIRLVRDTRHTSRSNVTTSIGFDELEFEFDSCTITVQSQRKTNAELGLTAPLLYTDLEH